MSDANKRPPLGGEVDWDEIGQNRHGGNNRQFLKVPYVKVTVGQSVKFRIVSKLYEFYRYFSPIVAISSGKDNDVIWREGKYKPKKTWTAYVINRANGTIQALDLGFDKLQVIMSWMQAKNGTFPRDPVNGCDWILTATKAFAEGGKQVTRYTLMPDAQTPLTKEEIATVDKFIEENPLSVLRKANSPEEIQEMWQSYLDNPDGPKPGTKEWFKARSERRKAENGGSQSSGAVSFQSKDKADIAQEDSSQKGFQGMMEADGREEAQPQPLF